jgi:uncharacterized protein with ParB-like and HNH nuclease domain
MSEYTALENDILSVRELLADSSLAIPLYQRPYKWTAKHVGQLFLDIAIFKDRSSYRLGTVVLHKEDELKNIVDGQQRILTLLLTVKALINYRLDELERRDLSEQLKELNKVIIDPGFSSKISKQNLYNNYLEISRIVTRSDFTEDHIDFLLNKCQFVIFSLYDISEAFQFFDSQNARGRDLEPHDLLKAFHLREFSSNDEPIKGKTVSTWENSETEELTDLFARYLYRIRNWTKGESARYFGKDDTPLFKGVNIELIANYPYIEHLRMAHYFVDHYNDNYERNIDQNNMDFPFHLDQIIINGRRFFEMTNHYLNKVSQILKVDSILDSPNAELDGYAVKILLTIENYEGMHRTGDHYVRGMFDCLLIFYIDKFGFTELSRAIEKIFIWAYSLRLKMQVLQLASMDNYVLEVNLCKKLKDAITPTDFTNCSLDVVYEIRSKRTEEIKELFRKMKYYEE